MIHAQTIDQFLESCKDRTLFDTRTPSEFFNGHIPLAINLPLFTDSERAEVGTLYKKSSREAAIKYGLDVVGPKLRSLIEKVDEVAKGRRIALHCWRGGMRSGSLAWLLDLYGFDVVTLIGGYKSFRRWVLSSFERERQLVILGGRTGAGKTHVLHRLAELGEQTLDLERISNHKGSAFGWIDEPAQPFQEQFENELAMALFNSPAGKRIWVEDESVQVGKNRIPAEWWKQMRSAPVVYLDKSRELRLEGSLTDYSVANVGDLEVSIHKITKRLGGERTKQAVSALEVGDLFTAGSIILGYYDALYDHALTRRESGRILKFNVPSNDHYATALLAIDKANELD